jgi:hypothetical protein
LVSSLVLAVITGAVSPSGAADVPSGQMTWAVHISLAPTWFDPAETSGIITPFMVRYALHDAVLKPLPGPPMAPSLAEKKLKGLIQGGSGACGNAATRIEAFIAAGGTYVAVTRTSTACSWSRRANWT